MVILEKSIPRAIFLKNHFASCDAGVIDSDFCGTNDSKDPILIKAGQKTEQIVFHKKEVVVFKKVDCFSSTERGAEVLVQQEFNFL